MTKSPERPWLVEYEALTAGAGVVDFSDRTLVELNGDDRAQFLHNLSTNDIRRLQEGAGCEAFLTNVQGKTLAYVYVFAEPDRLVIETGGGMAEKMLAHLDRYLVREKVVLADRGQTHVELYLAGAEADQVLARLDVVPPGAPLGTVGARIAGHRVQVRRCDYTGPVGYLIESAKDSFEGVRAALVDAGAQPCGREALEAARVECGTPIYGRDITEKNLPQEIARDQRAISFVKGCYLGQETVARIDALGHVNRTLAGVRFEGPQLPETGAALVRAGQDVGHVTSATFSPALAAPLALAYLRRGSEAVGTQLESATGPAEVVQLPVRSV